jgi:hypothetical protein
MGIPNWTRILEITSDTLYERETLNLKKKFAILQIDADQSL